MTGLELKIYFLLFSVAVLAPALIFSIYRTIFSCGKDEDNYGGYGISIAAYLLYPLFVFLFFFISNWNERLTIMFMVGLSIPVTLAVTFHVFLITIFSKIFSFYLPPKSECICLSNHQVLFILVTAFYWVIVFEKIPAISAWLSGLNL